MIKFSVIYPDTGIIYTSGYCPDVSCLPDLSNREEFPEGLLFKMGTMGKPETERFDGDDLVAYVPPETLDEVVSRIVRERQRRMALGFEFDFGDARGVHHIGTTEADMVGWRDVNDVAFKSMARGQTTKQIAIVTDTGPTIVTASEWLDVLDAAEAFRQPIWAASFALQAADPIPPDFANDSYWPT